MHYKKKVRICKNFFAEIENKTITDYNSLPKNDITLLLFWLKKVPNLTERQLERQLELVTNITNKFDYIFAYILIILEKNRLNKHNEFKETISTNLDDIEAEIAGQLNLLDNSYDDAIVKQFELVQIKNAEDQAKSAAAKEVSDQYVREMTSWKRGDSGGGRRIKKRTRRHKKKRGKKTRGKKMRATRTKH